MREKDGHGAVFSHSNKTDKSGLDGSGGMVDVQIDDHKGAVSVNVGTYGLSEVNSYKGGKPKSKSDPSMNKSITEGLVLEPCY